MGDLALGEFNRRDLEVQERYRDPLALPYQMEQLGARIDAVASAGENIADQGKLAKI
jgi:hypothetical protein